MPLLLWTPEAVSYLAQLALAVTICAYFLRRLLSDRKRGDVSAAMLWLFITVAALIPVVLLYTLRAALDPAYQGYTLPLIAPFWAISNCALIRFSYLFPQRLSTGRLEKWGVRAACAVYICHELWVGVHRMTDVILHGLVWYREAAMDLWVVAGAIWAVLVLIRQILQATDPTKASLLRRLVLVRNREAGTARSYLVFAGLPLAMALIFYLRSYGVIGAVVTEVSITWIMLAMLCGLALIFLNYMPERSSFQVKIAGVSLTLILAIISGMSWLIGPVYINSYHSDDRIASHQTYRYTPQGGGYRVERIAYTYESDIGQSVDLSTGQVTLPFDFPFFDQTYREIFVREDGMTAFFNRPIWLDLQFGRGRLPMIVPMAVELGGDSREAIAPGTGVMARHDPERLIVTWHQLRETRTPSRQYSFQMTLHRNGMIDMSYAQVPDQIRYNLYEKHQTVWMSGLSPGFYASGVQVANLTRDLPLHTAPGHGIMQDDYLEFLRYVDRLYAPVAAFMILAVLVVVILLPAFLRLSLVRPLNRLLGGVETFRNGQLQAAVPVTYHDEIGFLTAAFNDMAKSQHDLIETLEDRVAQRTAQVAEMTARNARLEERVRLSGDLHDTVSQTLFSAAMLADSLPAQMKQDTGQGEAVLARIGTLSRHALGEMRQLLSELRTPNLESRSLGPSLQNLAREFETEQAVAVHLDITADAPLLPEVGAMFYRVAQEALNNVAKHAGASRVEIGYDSLSGQAMLTLRDDGCGFDTSLSRTGHLGLHIMRERSQRIGAVLEIESAMGLGTTVTLIWLPQDTP